MKIALLGSAPSWSEAPFNDSSWEIWACNAKDYPRIDRYFQFHPDQDLTIYPGLMEWMRTRKDPIYMQHERADIPASITYPLKALTEKYGTWFFTSSVAYMLALALEQPEIEEIGLWGISMQDSEEYRAQRPGCHFFLQLAKMRGIKLTVPKSCELLVDGGLYLYSRNHRIYAKLMAHKEDLQKRQGALREQKENILKQRCLLLGALEIKEDPEVIRAKLAELNRQEPGVDRGLILLDGALQLIEHGEKNWLEEAV